MSEIIIEASVKPKPEYYEPCRQALLELRAKTLAEPGCLQFDILESEDKDGHIYFYERFLDQESFDLHFTYEYTQSVFDSYKVWLDGDVNIARFIRAV